MVGDRAGGVEHLERLVRLPALQQVKQMFSLELQPESIRDRVELRPLSTQSKLLQNQTLTKIKHNSFTRLIFWDAVM